MLNSASSPSPLGVFSCIVRPVGSTCKMVHPGGMVKGCGFLYNWFFPPQVVENTTMQAVTRAKVKQLFLTSNLAGVKSFMRESQ